MNRLLERFNEYLPEPVSLVSERLGALAAAKIVSGNRLLGLGMDADERVAAMEAVGDAVAAHWVKAHGNEFEGGLVWAYGASLETARAKALAKAVKHWAWLKLAEKSYVLSPAQALLSELKGEASDHLEIDLDQVLETKLSFFEPTSAIHQLRFFIAKGESAKGTVIGSVVVREAESPRVSLLRELMHQALVHKSAAPWTITANEKGEPWPAFRMDQFFGRELSGGLGHLWAARVEGAWLSSERNH